VISKQKWFSGNLTKLESDAKLADRSGLIWKSVQS